MGGLGENAVPSGGDGVLGIGGAGGHTGCCGGGGGGGGVFGGGGGGDAGGAALGAGGGGGGGSGFGTGTSNTVIGSDTTGTPSVTLTYSVAAVPTASISTPVDGATYALGQAVSSSFSCAEGAGGTGISACTDQGRQASGAAIDTSTTGQHTYTVTAISKDGLTGKASVTYTVAGAPSVSITSPSSGAGYTSGQVVDAGYGCQEGASGPGLSSCSGTVPAGQPIDTDSPGVHSFAVTAISRDGQSTTSTVSYTVALPANGFAITHVLTRPNGKVSFKVTFPGPGSADVLETGWLTTSRGPPGYRNPNCCNPRRDGLCSPDSTSAYRKRARSN